MMRFRLLAVSASLLLVAACTTEPTTVATRSNQASTSGVVLQVSVPDMALGMIGYPAWLSGVPDTIRITATNTADQPITLHFSSACQIMGYVRNAAGQVIWPPSGGWVCGQVLTTLEFQAHEVKTGAVVWATDSLPPGLYEVYAAFAAQEDSGQSNHVTQRLISTIVALDSLRTADGAALPCCATRRGTGRAPTGQGSTRAISSAR